MNKKSGFSKNGRSSAARLTETDGHLNHTPVKIPSPQGEVAANAYFIYMNEGCQHGQDVRHWLEAEAQMK